MALIAYEPYVHESHSIVANKEAVTYWVYSQDSEQREQKETPISQSFPERSLFACCKAAAWELSFYFGMQVGADWGPPWRSGKPVDTSTDFFL